MKLNSFVLYLLLLYSSCCFAQNLVRNPSFEEYTNCDTPDTFYSYDTAAYNNQYFTAKYWVSPTLSTADWFNKCSNP